MKEDVLAEVIDPSSTGLLLVDVQNGFCHPEGELGRLGQGASLQEVVPRIAALADAAHRAGIRRFWSRQEHDPADVARARHRVETHISKAGHLPCVRGTWDAEIVDDLQELMHDGDYVFVKHRASCFYNTPLEVQLRMSGITCLIVAGVTTNYCVDSTIRDAYARDLDLVVVGDCCAARDPELHEATLRNTALFHGLVCQLEQIGPVLASLASERAENASIHSVDE